MTIVQIDPFPAMDHSPVIAPARVLLTTMADMNKGHPRAAPKLPNFVVEIPYKVMLPNQRIPIQRAINQYNQVPLALSNGKFLWFFIK